MSRGNRAPEFVHGKVTCNASDITEQSEQSLGRQDQENQGFKTDIEEIYPKLSGICWDLQLNG